MSGCALRRWGPGIQCNKTDTPASKEMADKLAALRAERDKLDTIWTRPAESEKTQAAQAAQLHASYKK